MNLDAIISKIVGRNPKLKRAVREDPQLKRQLTGIVDDYYSRNKGLLSWAKFNDKINRILGPAEAGLRYFSPLGTVGFGLYSAAKLLHYALIKLPYTIYYAAKTRDLKGSIGLALSDIAKYVIPFGTAADILPLYERTVNKYIVNQSKGKLEHILARGKRVKVPKKLGKYGLSVGDDHLYVNTSGGYELRTREVGNGTHEVYLEKQKGIHPNVYRILKLKKPRNLKELILHKNGFVKRMVA